MPGRAVVVVVAAGFALEMPNLALFATERAALDLDLYYSVQVPVLGTEPGKPLLGFVVMLVKAVSDIVVVLERVALDNVVDLELVVLDIVVELEEADLVDTVVELVEPDLVDTVAELVEPVLVGIALGEVVVPASGLEVVVGTDLEEFGCCIEALDLVADKVELVLVEFDQEDKTAVVRGVVVVAFGGKLVADIDNTVVTLDEFDAVRLEVADHGHQPSHAAANILIPPSSSFQIPRIHSENRFDFHQ